MEDRTRELSPSEIRKAAEEHDQKVAENRISTLKQELIEKYRGDPLKIKIVSDLNDRQMDLVMAAFAEAGWKVEKTHDQYDLLTFSE